MHSCICFHDDPNCWITSADRLCRNTQGFTHHPSAGFVETLERMDRDDRFVTSQDQWFRMDEANVWVIFLDPETDLQYQSELVQKIWSQIGVDLSEVSRLTATLTQDQELAVQFVRLSETLEKADYLGCIAAVDLISMAYPRLPNSIELQEANCQKYRYD